MKHLLAMLAVCGCAAVAQAVIIVETYGTAPRPASVAGQPVDAAPFNPLLHQDITATPVIGGEILFSPAVNVRQVGDGWATWSGGYTGNVFYPNGATSLTLTFRGSSVDWFVGAQLYAEPNPFGVFDISATATDASGASSFTITQAVNGDGGASGWGFYSPNSFLRTITLTADVDFAVGDLATTYFIPAPGTLALVLAGLATGRRRRAG